MRRGAPPPRRGGRAGVGQGVRRLWPVALAAWRRWDSLSPQEKERYRRMASEYARRGRETLNQRAGGRQQPRRWR